MLRFRALETGVVLLAVPMVAAQPPSFHGLGEFHPGAVSSFALSVSGSGHYAVGEIWVSDTDRRAFRWSLSGGVELFLTSALARGSSYHGSVVVGQAYWPETGQNAGFRWTEAGGAERLSMLDAFDVSDDGSVIVAYNLRWRNGVVSTLAPGMLAFAYAVSGDGAVVVGWYSNGDPDPNRDTRAFRWTEAGGLQDLGDLGGEAVAEGTNQDGSVIVGQSRDTNGLWRAFRWTGARGMQDLGTLGGAMSAAFDVSADGSVVVGQSLLTSATGSERAFRWTEQTGMEDVRTLLIQAGVSAVEDWRSLRSAAAVSGNGNVIVGYGRNPGNFFEAWRAVLPWSATPGDLDGDGDVDLHDYAVLADCMVGPNGAMTSGCESADLDEDRDADLADFAVFQAEFPA